MEKREFAFYPEDFGHLPAKPIHMDLSFDVYDDHTDVKSDFLLKTYDQPLKEITLNAKNMKITSVSLYTGPGKQGEKKPAPYTYDKEKNELTIHFEHPVQSHAEFCIHTETITRPSKTTLEGLYFDETPKGAPPTQITQCQQWGFQRLAPCLDDMRAKCTYTTEIIADARYTNLISNGDLVEEETQGKRKRVVYHNHKTPMATYLFFLGVGTYATFKKECEYATGKKFILELLVPPGSDESQAVEALDILYNGILWINLHTGKDKYEQLDKKKKIEELIRQRDKLKQKKDTEELSQIRDELKHLAKELHLGYEYTGDVYREIGMQNSNFGGMENVGNTTISTNRIMPFKQMTDGAFEYLIAVKVHEFYHNLNGSEVTGDTPFSIWLNEAVTVHIEDEYGQELMGELYKRLERVLTLYAPMGGTFTQDRSITSMPIEPVGFNNPDELITGVTYVKAPEFVHMIQTLMGKEKFVEGLETYHKKYKHSNASTKDWLHCMEQAAQKDFKEMAHGWLSRPGYPTLNISQQRTDNQVSITIEQSGHGDQPWQFPFTIGVFDNEGQDIAEQTLWVKQAKETLTFEDIPEEYNLSLNRNHHAYVKTKPFLSKEQVSIHALKDPDLVNRHMAFTQLMDHEKIALIKKETTAVSQEFLDIFGKILQQDMDPGVKAMTIAVGESVYDESLSHKYQEIYDAKEAIKKAVAEKFSDHLLSLYHDLAKKSLPTSELAHKLEAIKARQLKNVCLSFLATLDTPQAHKLIKEQFKEAENASDKHAAFSLYLNSSASDRTQLLEDYKKEAAGHLVSWESFLYAVGSTNAPDALDLIKGIEKDEFFRVEQTNDQRALFSSFARNRKKSLLTEEGLAYLTSCIIKLGSINEYVTFLMLSNFNDINKLDTQVQQKMRQALEKVQVAITKEVSSSVYNTVQRILSARPQQK